MPYAFMVPTIKLYIPSTASSSKASLLNHVVGVVVCLDGWSRILHVTGQCKQMEPAVANAIDFRLLPGEMLIYLYD